ncbi:hypothetical protein ScPMuIL_004232 [Solemya velum]
MTSHTPDWDLKQMLMGLPEQGYEDDILSSELRKQFTEAFNKWLDVPEEILQTITEAVDMVHQATSLIENLEHRTSQESKMIPSECGLGTSIHSANSSLLLALQKLLRLDNSTVVQVYTDCLLETHRRYSVDMYLRDSQDFPDEKEYRRMATSEAGKQFELTVKLVQIFSINKKNFQPLVQTFGLYYQIHQDYLKIFDKKSGRFPMDVAKGKFLYPLLHAILSEKDNNEMLSILFL